MQDIHEDAHHKLHQDLESAHCAYNEQKAQFNWLQSDYKSLKDQLDDKWRQGQVADNDVSQLRDNIVYLEAQVCKYKGKAWDSISMMTSILSSMKGRWMSLPCPPPGQWH